MQNYCGEVKREELLEFGLQRLKDFEKEAIPNTFAYNPHELFRLLEVIDILTVSQIIIHASLARKTNSKALCFFRDERLVGDPDGKDRELILIKQDKNQRVQRTLPLDFFGDFNENYSKYNLNYLSEQSGRDNNV